MNINDFARRKVAGDKVSMVTCYDYWSAQLLNQSDVDTLLAVSYTHLRAHETG